MPADVFIIKQSDTQPPLQRQLQSADGTPVDLTTAGSVVFKMKRLDGPDQVLKVDHEDCTIIAPATDAIVRYQWQPGDTDTPGTYLGEFEVMFGIEPVNFPNDGYVIITVTPELGLTP